MSPRKKKSETEKLVEAVKNGGKAESTLVEEEEEVVPESEQVVADVVESPPEPASTPPGLTIISELQTKQVKQAPVSFVDNDAKVLAWYQGRAGGQLYTLVEAALDLDISAEELSNSLIRLTATVLPKSLDHITDFPKT
jgi:hypothetical protein